VSAFPAEIQSSVAGQLADCFVAVIAQRLRFRPELNIRVPECEILVATHAVKNFIRNRDFFKIASSLETGAEHGMWSFQRYRSWLESRKSWYIPGQTPEAPELEAAETSAPATPPPAFPLIAKPSGTEGFAAAAPPRSAPKPGGRIEIEPVEGEFGKILKRPGQ
jgi:twitching motility protein PilT